MLTKVIIGFVVAQSLWAAGAGLFPSARARTNLYESSPIRPDTNSNARVVIVHDASATEAFQPQPRVVAQLVRRAISHQTGKTNLVEAWTGLVSTNEVVGLKVHSQPGPNSGTRIAVVAAVIEEMLKAGFPPTNIVVWDKYLADLRLAGYTGFRDKYGVRVESSAAAAYDENSFYENPLLGNLVWGDFEFGKKGEGVGRKSFVSKLLTRDITKIINITPLLNHNHAGVAGNLYGLAMASVDNTIRFESDTAKLAVAVPEIYALPELGDRVVLNIVDALICQYHGSERTRLHYSTQLNELRFSLDPVALDVLSIQELDRQRELAKAPPSKTSMELYENASLLQLGISNPRHIDIERSR